MVTTPPTYQLGQFCFVFLSWAQFVTFLSPFSPPLFLLSPWSALLCLLPMSPGLWLILLLLLVCGIFYGSLCLQRGAGQLKVFRASGKAPSTAVSPVMQVRRGTPWPPQAQNLSSLCPSMAGSELLGRRGWPQCRLALSMFGAPSVLCPLPKGTHRSGGCRPVQGTATVGFQDSS